jgi:peptidoglycan/LPS O-acetylase OafA/YrhL
MASERAEIRALTGIRGFAAVWVVLFHLGWNGMYEAFPRLEAIRPLAQTGYLGVDLFFILSGFILTWNYGEALADWRPREHVRFEIVRLARIYPVHLATLVVIAAAVAVEKTALRGGPWLGARYDPRLLPQHVLLVQAWVPGLASWNVPSWTISAEWAAYLAFPLFCPAVARIRSAAAAIAGAALLMAATVWSLRALGFGDALTTDNPGGLVRIAGEFGAGCLLCRAFVLAGDGAARWSWLALPSLGAIAAAVVLNRADPWAMPAFGVLIVSLAADRGAVARFLGAPWNLLLGRASYSLYMTHWLVLGFVSMWTGRADLGPDASLARRVAWLAVTTASLAGAALVTWRFVEEPARRSIRRWTAPRPLSPSAAR